MTLEEIIHYRRSVRHYKNEAIDAEKVKHSIELATLARTHSSSTKDNFDIYLPNWLAKK